MHCTISQSIVPVCIHKPSRATLRGMWVHHTSHMLNAVHFRNHDNPDQGRTISSLHHRELLSVCCYLNISGCLQLLSNEKQCALVCKWLEFCLGREDCLLTTGMPASKHHPLSRKPDSSRYPNTPPTSTNTCTTD